MQSSNLASLLPIILFPTAKNPEYIQATPPLSSNHRTPRQLPSPSPCTPHPFSFSPPSSLSASHHIPSQPITIQSHRLTQRTYRLYHSTFHPKPSIKHPPSLTSIHTATRMRRRLISRRSQRKHAGLLRQHGWRLLRNRRGISRRDSKREPGKLWQCVQL